MASSETRTKTLHLTSGSYLAHTTLTNQAQLVNDHQAQVGSPFADKSLDRSVVFDGGQIWINLSSLKNQIASGNFILIIALASCFVLLYLFCLVAHLKGCNFSYNNKRESKQQLGEKSQSSVISSPYNLRMPPATKTRLDLMFGRKGGGSKKARDNRASGTSGSQRLKASDKGATFGRHADYSCCSSGGCTSYLEDQLLPSYSTLKMVRALRRASFLYRRKSNYTNSLKAIPESELEYLPSDIASFRNTPSQSFGQLEANDYVTYDQFDVLVREAMSQSCSHSLDRSMDNTNTKTLLTKPVDGDGGGPNRVSREGILVHS